MKKRLAGLICMVMVAASLVGCEAHTSKSYTFNVDTGDRVKIELDTSDGYDLKQENSNFYVEKDDTTCVTGTFATAETWEYYSDIAYQDEEAEVLEHTDDKLIWTTESGEYDMVYMLNDKTGVVTMCELSDEFSESDADAVLAKLTFTLD